MRGWRVRARVRAVRAAARAEAAEDDAGPGWELDPDKDPLRWLPAAWDADPDLNPDTSSSLDPGHGGGGHAAPQQGASKHDRQLGSGSHDWQHVPADESGAGQNGLDRAGMAAFEVGSAASQLPASDARRQVTLHTQPCMPLQCHVQCLARQL